MGGDKNGVLTLRTDSEAGQQVQKRLSDEHTLAGIDRLLSRIDTLEKALANLTTLMQQGPGMVAMAGDMVDETYKQADANGVNIDVRLKNALVLAEKLTAPAMVEKLNGLVTFSNQLPGLLAMTGDMIDESYRQADANGVSLDNRLKNALTIADRLTAPAMVEKLDNLMTLADQLPGLVAMTVDVVDEQMKGAIASGFDPKALAETASAANSALTKARTEPPAKASGIFSLMRALRDPDRQKGIGFLLNFLKHFGRNI